MFSARLKVSSAVLKVRFMILWGSPPRVRHGVLDVGAEGAVAVLPDGVGNAFEGNWNLDAVVGVVQAVEPTPDVPDVLLLGAVGGGEGLGAEVVALFGALSGLGIDVLRGDRVDDDKR
jgi:hypothetical protein